MCANPVMSVVLDNSGQQLRAMFVRLHTGHAYANPSMASRRRMAAAIGETPTVTTRLGVSYLVRSLRLAQQHGGA